MESFLRQTAVPLIALLILCSTAPATAQNDSGYEIDYRDNGTVVETIEIGNTTYRTTTTSDGTVYETTRRQIGNTTYYEGSSSDGWTFEGSSSDYGSMSTSNTDYYDSTGSFTGSSETSTFDYGGSSTTYYEGYDGGDYEYETTTNFDYDY